MGLFASIRTALSRIGAALGLWIEKSTESDAMNEAVVEKSIRSEKEKADKAHYANGQLKATILLLKQQVKDQGYKQDELKRLIELAIKENDEANGSIYAEELANLEGELKANQEQLTTLEDSYKQNTDIIAESLRQIPKLERQLMSLKAQVRVSRNMESVAQMMKASISELQGMVGGEAANAMQRMREASVQGQGQMQATMDLAKEMGSNIRMQQDARKARGRALFNEFKQKAAIGVQAPEATTEAKPVERQKIEATA